MATHTEISNSLTRIMDLWRGANTEDLMYVFYNWSYEEARVAIANGDGYPREKFAKFKNNPIKLLCHVDDSNLRDIPRRLKVWHRRKYG